MTFEFRCTAVHTWWRGTKQECLIKRGECITNHWVIKIRYNRQNETNQLKIKFKSFSCRYTSAIWSCQYAHLLGAVLNLRKCLCLN